MALTERDMELVNMAAREAAYTAIRESDVTLRMMAREEAKPIAEAETQQHAKNCPFPGQAKISMLKLIIVGLVAGGGTGTLMKLPEILGVLMSIVK